MPDEKMPCPTCEELIALRAFGSTDSGSCPACATVLRRVVPLFAITAPPYGWLWARADDPRWFKVDRHVD